MPAKTLKAADKQTILKKLVTEMKRRYGGSVPKQQRSALETLLFAACLEDSNQRDAEAEPGVGRVDVGGVSASMCGGHGVSSRQELRWMVR